MSWGGVVGQGPSSEPLRRQTSQQKVPAPGTALADLIVCPCSGVPAGTRPLPRELPPLGLILWAGTWGSHLLL